MKKGFIFFVVIITFISCSYEFSSDNFIDLDQPIYDTQYIEVLDFNTLDTINVQRTFNYIFNGLESQNTITSKVYINNQQINSNWEGNLGTFTIRPENYDDGTYTIRIEHTFNSGSGSIADQSGLETITENALFEFVVNREPSDPPPVLSANIINGTIFIEWSTTYEMDYTNAFLSLKYKTTEIRIPLSDNELALGSYNDNSTVLYIGNSNTPNFDEYSSVTYSILFESEFEERYGLSQSLYYDTDMVTTEIEFVDFDSYKFKWSAHPLYANFETFEFSFAGGQFLGSSLGGEYLVQSPYIFGYDYTLNVRPTNAGVSLPFYAYRDVSLSSDTFGVFSMDPSFVREIIFNPTTNNFYALIIEDRFSNGYGFRIYEYSNTMALIRTSNTITYDNVRYEYLDITLNPVDNHIYVDARGSAYKIDINTLQIVENYNDSPLTSELRFRGDILARLDYLNNQLTVTNIATNTVLYSELTTDTRLRYLSPNGNYILINDDTGRFLYRIEGNQLIQVFDFTSIYLSGSIEIFEDTLFYATNGEIRIFDLLNSTSKSFSFGSTQQFIQYDSNSQRLLVSQSDQNAIYNTITEEIINFQSEDNKQTTGLFNSEDRDYFMRLWNNRLIHSKGIYINLD